MNKGQISKEQFFAEFKKAFLVSNFFKTMVCKDHDVYLISLGGSAGSDIDTDDSDYDIDVYITDDTELGEETEVAFYKNKKIHWHYWSISKLQYLAEISEESLYKNDRCLFGSLYGMAILSFDKIIWQDPDKAALVQKVQDYVIETRSKAAALFLAISKKDFSDVIKFCLGLPVEINIPVWEPRYFYRLFFCYKIATKGKLDDTDKEFILKIRQTKLMSEMSKDILDIIRHLCFQCLINDPYTWRLTQCKN